MAEYAFQIPFSEADMRQLTAGDLVYVTGNVLTVRDMAYTRTIEALDSKQPLPFELAGRAIWHAGPITRQDENGKWSPVSVGSTTSSRFTATAAQLIEKAGVKMVIGKGFMGPATAQALQKCGAVYAVTTGGTAAYYANQIPAVNDVHWLDLGMPAAVWDFQVNRLGPLIVALDSHGNNIFDGLTAKVDATMAQMYRDLAIDPQHKYLWWP